MADRSVRVLIVEDEPEAGELLRREIAEAGYAVEVAADARVAMAALAGGEHEILVADIRLPGMDGMELTRVAKELWPDLEVILVTGHASLESVRTAVRLGACDYLLKPLHDVNEVRRSLARASEKIQQRRQAKPTDSERFVGREALLAVLDLLPLAVLLLDAGGALRGKNRFADEILRRQCGLHGRVGAALTCTEAEHAPEFARLVETARTTRSEEQARVVGAMRLTGPDSPAGLPLLFIKLGHAARPGGAQDAATLIVLPAPELGVPDTARLLVELYGLTAAEARLAALTLRGASLEESARMLGIAEATARTHLRRIFAKTKTGRQGELVSLLLSGPALLRPGSGVAG